MVPYQSRKALRNLKAGINKMEDKLTVADKVYRSFRAGRPFKKDRLMQPYEALAEVCGLRDKLRAAMQKEGLDPNDSAAAIVFWRTMDEPPMVRRIPVGRETDVLEQMYTATKAAVTIGALFAMRDHERGEGRRWKYPFLLSDEAQDLLEQALDSQEMKAN
jgi:hypothetical protein